MDSLTQVLLGAACAAAAVPAGHRRPALLAGAVLGTLPDLDVLPLALLDDPVANMTWHRSVSHSLFVLVPLAIVLWTLARRWSVRVREAPRRWLAAIVLALATHPLLDAHTVYGTQLWWPLPVAPTMWSTVFIIDPLYTVPLLAAVLVAAVSRDARRASRALAWGLAASSAYLGWSWTAKALVEHRLAPALAAAGLRDAPRVSIATPFNTWSWRVLVRTPTGFAEYYAAPFGGPDVRGTTPIPADHALLAATLDASPAARRLQWFTHGFLAATRESDEVVLTDLRMGAQPHYIFRFVVAEGDPPRAVPPRQLPPPAFDLARLRDAWR